MGRTRKLPAVAGALVALATLLAACGESGAASPASSASRKPTTAAAASVDVTKLPLGDGRYRTSPAKGYVDTCQTRFGGGGAFRNGPWIDEQHGTWDLKLKISVAGSVRRTATGSSRVSGSSLWIAGNGLPARSGVFPVAANDPAFQYDRNPNTIQAYTLSVRLPATPRVSGTPTCIGGTIGVSATGIPIFSAFDAGGRDAAAHEIQDAYGGHPQMSGQYHYHSLPATWKDARTKGHASRLFGYALDGFGIYGAYDEHGKRLSTASLDACHGRTSTVLWHGKYRRIYHYVATADFPYLVSCYRGTPITSATGLGIGRPG